jgi:hypothetical protein
MGLAQLGFGLGVGVHWMFDRFVYDTGLHLGISLVFGFIVYLPIAMVFYGVFRKSD